MNPDVIQFQCSACHTTLTVPAQMAGVTGPCPSCGQTITSPAATPAPSFGGGIGSPFPVPAPSPQRPASQPSPPPGFGGSSPHLTPHAGPAGIPSASPQGGFLGQRPPSAMPEPQQQPAWQAPGLGQTLMGAANSIPEMTGSPALPPVPQPPPVGGSFLPPRRQEGQTPSTGASPSSPASPWGGGPPGSAQVPSSFPSPRSLAAGGLAGTMPNNPSIPPFGASVLGGGNGSISPLGHDLSGMPPPAPASGELSMPTGKGKSGERPRVSSKAGRSSNFLTFVMALLFLVGFLAAAGWLFREPLLNLGHQYAPGLTEKIEAMIQAPAEINDPNLATLPLPSTSDLPTPAATGDAIPLEKEAPTASSPPSSVASTPAPTTGFDPNEAAPPKALTPTPTDLGGIPPAPEKSLASTPTTAFPAPAPTDGPAAKSGTSGLMEVPSKSVIAGVPRGDEAVSTATSIKDVKLEVTPEGKPAAEALQKFLTSRDGAERIRYTLAADVMQPLMERYYSVNDGGPIHVDSITQVRLDKNPQLGGGTHAVFGVESKTWEFPVPVMLEEGKDGFRVDWLSFVEFKDRLLERFFKGYQEGPARFHVGITRTHYFEDVVPNADNKDAFRVSPAPPNPYQATVFVDKDSVLGRELRDKIPWGSQVWAIVELEWIRLGNQQWVELAAVPQLNWYSVPTAPKSSGTRPPLRPETSAPPSAPKRAIPVGR